MLAQLKTVLPPPISLIAVGGWREVEQELGTALPDDYREFVATYGAGTIDGFLSIFTPAGPTKWIDVIWRSRDHDDLPTLFTRREQHPPFDAFPSPGGLLAFGQTDNGDVLYWKTDGSPFDWTVVVFPGRDPDYFEFDGAMTDFLTRVLSRSLRVDLFPRDFPSADPKFEPIYPFSETSARPPR